MNIETITNYIDSMFTTSNDANYKDETGLTVKGSRDIKKIGYCTNLTIKVVEKAKKLDVDLIITHHDTWDFIYGLREACANKLTEYGISHYFSHLPLDDCAFGTNATMANKLELINVELTHKHEGFFCGRVGELREPIEFCDLVTKLEIILEEPLRNWQFNDRLIKRIGFVCGGGGETTLMKDVVDKECDVYFTGEKSLYTIEYAQFTNTNLIIGSHTFMELPGVESFAMKIGEKFEDVSVIRLNEEHLEAYNKSN